MTLLKIVREHKIAQSNGSRRSTTDAMKMHTCLNCGRTFRGQISHRNRFCSRKCVDAGRWMTYKQKSPQVHLSISNAQYIAAMLDAEGSIRLDTEHWGQVSVANTHRATLKRIQRWIGFGRVYLGSSSNKKPCYYWGCSSQYASENLLRCLLPYLHVKKCSAEKAVGESCKAAPMSWSYVAGFFDGEGTVYHDKADRRYSFQTTNTNQQVLEEIRVFTGLGRIYHVRGTNIYRHEIYRWREQLLFIKAVLPFAIIKYDKLVSARRFISSKKWLPFSRINPKLAGLSDVRLRHLYVDCKLTSLAIASNYDVAYPSILRRLQLAGIPRRHGG